MKKFKEYMEITTEDPGEFEITLGLLERNRIKCEIFHLYCSKKDVVKYGIKFSTLKKKVVK